MKVLETSREFTASAYDVDAFGIVSNIVYVRWLEDLRMALTSELRPVIDLFEKELFSIISQTTINYLKPMRFMDNAIGTIWIEEASLAKWVVGAELRDKCNDHVICRATQFGVFYNFNANKVIQVPMQLRNYVKNCREKYDYESRHDR